MKKNTYHVLQKTLLDKWGAVQKSKAEPTDYPYQMNKIKNKTQGEIQFENYCTLNQIEFDRIPEGTKREPDYKLKIRKHEIFTEIKDFDLTEEGKNNIYH